MDREDYLYKEAQRIINDWSLFDTMPAYNESIVLPAVKPKRWFVLLNGKRQHHGYMAIEKALECAKKTGGVLHRKGC